jgi:hypothetical protein
MILGTKRIPQSKLPSESQFYRLKNITITNFLTMTIQQAIDLAKKFIEQDLKYIELLRQYDVEHPDTSSEKLGYRITKLVCTIMLDEVILLCQIINEITSKSKKF